METVICLYVPAGNPNSVMSPASASQSEDQLYMDKLKQLSKYIEPLRRMINKIDKNEGIVCVFKLPFILLFIYIIAI